MSSLRKSTKTQRQSWSDYLVYGNEPKAAKHPMLVPELEEELLEHGMFLKQRVWRNMRKLQHYNPNLERRRHMREVRGSRIHRLRHRPLIHT